MRKLLSKKKQSTDAKDPIVTRSFLEKALDDRLKNVAMKDDLKQFATKDDLKQFATKDDLKRFATKEDLKKFATMEDLKRFATKDDLSSYVTKDYLDKAFKDYTDRAFRVFATKEDLRQLEERMDRKMSEKIDEVYKICDSIAKRLDTFLSEHVIINHRLDRLEQHVGISSVSGS